MQHVDPLGSGPVAGSSEPVLPPAYGTWRPAVDGDPANRVATRTMLTDGIAAVAAAIEDGRWLESLALVECLLRPATDEALRHTRDAEWAADVDAAVSEWRHLRNAGVEWHFRRATADTALRVRPDDPLWLAAHDGLDLLAALAAPDLSAGAADGRRADEYPADERPADERPADERPADERPAGSGATDGAPH